jgi:hypothetical protein
MAHEGSHRAPRRHREGYNRPKTSFEWAIQVFFAIPLLVAIINTLVNPGDGLGFFAIVGIPSLIIIIFTEWASRCEDTRKVAAVVAVVWAIYFILDALQRHERHQAMQRRLNRPPPSTPNAPPYRGIDFGDR